MVRSRSSSCHILEGVRVKDDLNPELGDTRYDHMVKPIIPQYLISLIFIIYFFRYFFLRFSTIKNNQTNPPLGIRFNFSFYFILFVLFYFPVGFYFVLV